MLATPAFPFLLHLFANLEISHFTELQNLIEKAGLFNILATLRDSESQSWRESIPEGSSEGLLKPASPSTQTILKPFQLPEIEAGQ